MKLTSTNTAAIRSNLLWLSAIRHIALGGQIVALVFFSQNQDIGLPTQTLSLILALYAVIIFITWRRCYWESPLTEQEFFCHILLDIGFLSALFFFSGGATNPFVSFYLVPVSVAAATLPRRYGWLTTAASLAAYSLLLNHHVVIPALIPTHHATDGMNLHLTGMWVNFAMSAALITFFVARMALAIRQQETQLARHREEKLQNEQLLAIATLAAGTAHELGTPLNSIKLLSEELRIEGAHNPHLEKDLTTLGAQVDQCRGILQDLVKTASQTNQDALNPEPVDNYFAKLLERWQLMRPKVVATIDIAPDSPVIEARFHPSISQSIISLLNNAADASTKPVNISISWSEQSAIITITDAGPGIDEQQLKSLSVPFLTEKPDGMGLGLFLSKTSLDRQGGSIHFSKGEQGGTQTTIQLNLAEAR